MPENYEIISSILGMFVAGISFYIVMKVMRIVSLKIKKRKIQSFVANKKVEIMTYNHHGIPVVIKVDGKLKVL